MGDWGSQAAVVEDAFPRPVVASGGTRSFDCAATPLRLSLLRSG
jgi:hypothetical protein